MRLDLIGVSTDLEVLSLIGIKVTGLGDILKSLLRLKGIKLNLQHSSLSLSDLPNSLESITSTSSRMEQLLILGLAFHNLKSLELSSNGEYGALEGLENL